MRHDFHKSVFSYPRTLTTWHCPHSPAAAAASDRYLLPAEPTAANLQQRVCCCGPMLGQTDGRTPCRFIDLPRMLCRQCQQYSQRKNSVHHVCSEIDSVRFEYVQSQRRPRPSSLFHKHTCGRPAENKCKTKLQHSEQKDRLSA